MEGTLDRPALLALEVLLWQLVTNGVLPATPLAVELERYAGYSADDAGPLKTLASVVRAAARP
jgi:hypothetical protein